ncbi:4-hydroxythreonine-4-phosphate dehydrogenase PdxA [Bartonella sp. HY329]|uniref:4-hydroxythreonine-4-phosphate dehydrogenase PdxA n=1 Tax=unclassified Bartonella TaxID=2645622 RepID=UPI0021C6E206|nr:MULTISPECIES: 4-hydroxythreonine-4-phosphate dehydrogenase PdxA [unclassified Bartonella]UXM93901.1 4-hydroxythreonine-4-phosphate dehydrogenase PdxA [Bartonella sp. HY329]UXN08222.1 4-hydroxythreonine-4-phosphate dehydrogenase PdxA [Bartonella sp. HY328]
MLPIAISSGDPSGIGLEIALKAWLNRKSSMLSPFFIIGDATIITQRAKLLGLDVDIEVTNKDNLAKNFDFALPVLPLTQQQINQVGVPLKENSAGIIESIEQGVSLIFAKKARAIVTCPIAKINLYEAGFKFPGHTEFLAALSQQYTGKAVKPVMMLAGPHLRTVPVTVHIPLKQVPLDLTQELIIEVATICNRDLIEKFGIGQPRIAIAGLNPHAGESGAMGTEDRDIIQPAINMLRQQGIIVSDPMPSDTMFHTRARQNYDVALCMYHDQALIPVKTIGFDETVNVTLGLPFIRTSPDHGTAFDIANEGVAMPDSLIAAIQLADKLSLNSALKH